MKHWLMLLLVLLDLEKHQGWQFGDVKVSLEAGYDRALKRQSGPML